MTTTSTEANQSQGTPDFASLPERELELSAGTVRYREAGAGEPILFVHGLLVDGRLWHGVADLLSDRFRCIVPDWPMGSHTLPMKPAADLAPPAMASLVGEMLDRLGIERATVVGNDSGGAVSQMLTAQRPELVERLVLTNCDTEDNFPPFPFSAMPPLARVPGGFVALTVPFRLGPIRRFTYGLLTDRPLPAELVDAWLAPSSSDARIREDARKLTAGIRNRDLTEVTARLAGFERPVLFAWGSEDRLFAIRHAERLATRLPDAKIERIAGAKTFVALDQPQRLAEAIGAFIAP
jgi:pimeloyl-ACP methyl ester carboxylesterase